MALGRVKTWISEILTAADLNAEFNNILNNATSLISPATAAWDMDGKELILDADADTSITADTDDQIDFKAGGSDICKVTATGFSTITGMTLTSASNLAVTAGDVNLAAGAINTARATVASAATTAEIWAADGNQINWTGTTTCTGFPAASQAGAHRLLICAASCGFTAGANMLISGYASGKTLSCVVNDVVLVMAVTTTQFKLIHYPYSRHHLVTPNVPSGGGTADAITITTVDGLGYADGRIITFLTIGANTITNPTLAIDGGGAYTVFNRTGGALSVGQIPNGAVVQVVGVGNSIRLISP